MTRRALVGSLAALAVFGTVVFAGDLESGLKPGKSVSPFHPLNVYNADNPSQNGKQNCLV